MGAARDFRSFFQNATGLAPFDYQRRLAEEPWPDVVRIPTGLGKTAAVILAWLYRRRQIGDRATPRRLVYCLPMRTLVEQTVDSTRRWLENLGLAGRAGEGGVAVHQLMGGTEELREAPWATYPEEDAVLVGTQDQLLSRALMRGYGMSRYQWPVHFALLHNDSLWVYDEVQLMGPALSTTAQIEAFRRAMGLAKPSLSLWLSATLDTRWLETVDFVPHIDNLTALELGAADRGSPTLARRLRAPKRVRPARARLSSSARKSVISKYFETLAREILESHSEGKRTLVVLNSVERAQALYRKLVELAPAPKLLLVHSRFRPRDRERLRDAIMSPPQNAGQIVVATQAVEAGVDFTSAVLFTELAPWPSVVQRLGRCNRYGEEETGFVFWIDIASDEELSLPYDRLALDRARERLRGLENAAPEGLPSTDDERAETLLLRRRDFLDLFNTDPDLSGFEVDVSPFIRDSGVPRVDVFWREFENQPSPDEPQPHRDELCPVSLRQIQAYLRAGRGRRTAWVWDPLGDGRERETTVGGRWDAVRLDSVRPGMTLLLRAQDGGYIEELGFDPTLTSQVEVLSLKERIENDSYDDDRRSVASRAIELAAHLADVANEAGELCRALDEPRSDAVRTAAAWHDVGKAHPVFQATMTRCEHGPDAAKLWAKSPCRGRHRRRHFRHELASMLAWLEHNGAHSERDLVAYLIAAHHGKVRMGLRALPGEDEPEDPGRGRFARGVHEGDVLPEVEVIGRRVPPTTLRLELMELGQGTQGPSWTERTHRLLEVLGPFRLAWLEALVRIADWRASLREQE